MSHETDITPIVQEIARALNMQIPHPDDEFYKTAPVKFHIPLSACNGDVYKAEIPNDRQFEPSDFRSFTSSPYAPQAGRYQFHAGIKPGSIAVPLGQGDLHEPHLNFLRAIGYSKDTGRSSLLDEIPEFSGHRIVGPHGMGGWLDSGQTFVDPHITIEVPRHHAEAVAKQLGYVTQQQAIGGSLPVGRGGNALAISGQFPSRLTRPWSGPHNNLGSLTTKDTYDLANEIIQHGGGFSPDINPTTGVASALLYPGDTLPVRLSQLGSLAKPHYGVPREEIDSVLDRARKIQDILRARGAEKFRVHALRTSYLNSDKELPEGANPAWQRLRDLYDEHVMKPITQSMQASAQSQQPVAPPQPTQPTP